jgi:hypothetical protein
MPSCATICAFIHIEIEDLSDQFALMHAHFLGRTAGVSNEFPRPPPMQREGTHLSVLPGRPMPAAFRFAGPLEAG